MKKLLQLAIVALIAYFVFTNYESWVDSIANIGQDLSRTGEPVTQGLCVTAAERAGETFSRGMRDYASPPVDLDAWDQFVEEVKERIYRAEIHCECPRDSCARAVEAMSELNHLIEGFDNSLRGGNLTLDPGRRMETIDSMLKRARELDRQGN